jgi:CspA family cold shock protein
MNIGTVKWFDPKKGFGFVVNEDGHDVFVHYTSILGIEDNFRCLRSGQEVEYRQVDNGNRLQGVDVRILEDVNGNVKSKEH